MRTTLLLLLLAVRASAADPDLAAILATPVIGPRHTVHEVTDFCEARFPRVPTVTPLPEWETLAAKWRSDVFEKVIFRGEAKTWRDAKLGVEYQADAPPGDGYTVKRLRYEAVPGMWVPALLYVPDAVAGKVPVVLNVNGHDGAGKAAKYKQIRCINLAKKGCLALNVEWVGMGQLRAPGFGHSKMNQLDLCGTAGIAVHYLALTRAIDVLLSHPNADPERVAVTGLSGGGWQTAFVSGLDTRVTLANPVAGYSSFFVKGRHPKDLGDSEQTPSDLATVVDYTHLTAMRAPRPTLLTFNAADNCCFEAGYALPPLWRAARPVFDLYGKSHHLRSHVSHDPGTHAYDRDNREALYRAVGDYFFPGDKGFDPKEVPADAEVRSPDDIAVTLPENNAYFNTLALELAKPLPRDGDWPTDRSKFETWHTARRAALREVVRLRPSAPSVEPGGAEVVDGLTVAKWRVRVGTDWTVPVLELSRGEPKKTAILLADDGRSKAASEVNRLLDAGYRVLAVDPLLLGEAQPIHPGGDTREVTFKNTYLYGLLLGAVGERPLGVQAGQVLTAARWAKAAHPGSPVTLVGVGPRTSLIALTAAALDPLAADAVEVTNPPGSLKQAIEENRGYEQSPEVFCFGLLETADVKHIAALIAPRPVTVRSPSERAKAEFAGLAAVYKRLGTDFDPLAP